MTQKAVVFGNEFFPAITIHGSDTAAEYLVVAESFKNINLMGNRGNDIFTVGYAFGGAATLKRVRGNLQLNGGEGDDFCFSETPKRRTCVSPIGTCISFQMPAEL